MNQQSTNPSASSSYEGEFSATDLLSHSRWQRYQKDTAQIAQAALHTMASTPLQNTLADVAESAAAAGNLTPNPAFDSTDQGAPSGFQPINRAVKPGATFGKRSAPDDPDTNPHTDKALKKTADGQAEKTTADEQAEKRKGGAAKGRRKKDNKAPPSQPEPPSSPALATPPGPPPHMPAQNKIARNAINSAHVTPMYTRYDPFKHKDLPVVAYKARNFSFDIFNAYPLYMELTNSDLTLRPEWDPPQGVRLDDYNCAEALLRLLPTDLHLRFPSEFDMKGMLRATRNPLGHARKIFVTAGMIDGDGNVAGDADVGYHYAWFKGLQPLMGHEGWLAGLYRVRPTGEKIKCPHLTWYLHSRCVIQYSAGHQGDVTFEAGALDVALGLSDRVARTMGTGLHNQIDAAIRRGFETYHRRFLDEGAALETEDGTLANESKGKRPVRADDADGERGDRKGGKKGDRKDGRKDDRKDGQKNSKKDGQKDGQKAKAKTDKAGGGKGASKMAIEDQQEDLEVAVKEEPRAAEGGA
jgi:hypothetical protein